MRRKKANACFGMNHWRRTKSDHMKVYCVYDNKNHEQLMLVADNLNEVVKFTGATRLYILQSIQRGNTVNKKKYIVKRIEIEEE